MENFERYNEFFYKAQRSGSYNSAKTIVSLLSRIFKIDSVVDVGCGEGTWLKAFHESGADEILGFDANCLPSESLMVPRDRIRIIDFEGDLPVCSKKYDVAVCLECLEHLTEGAARKVARQFCLFSDLLLFSAAIPFQDGENHINCHNLCYWSDIFRSQGFTCFDILRPQLIQGGFKIEPWYLQNILIFAKNDPREKLLELGYRETSAPVTFYHQELFRQILEKQNREHRESIDEVLGHLIVSNEKILDSLNRLNHENCYLKAQLDSVLARLSITQRVKARFFKFLK